MKKHFAYLFVLCVILLASCKKEYSYESGNNPSKGSLQDDGTGNCLPEVVKGIYIANAALVTTNNTMQVTVNVTKTGSYTIFTDTVNGYYFRASGIFSSLGFNQVTLNGKGTPIASGVDNFLVVYDSTACSVPVTVLPSGTGMAVGTLAGGPNACTPFTVSGIYMVSTLLAASDTVQVQINTTTAGAYSISTNIVNGFGFSATGIATTGTQTITLTGSGSPTVTGNATFTVTFGNSSCTFTVNVKAIDYFPRTTNSNWSYEFNNVSTDSLLRIVYPQTLTALGNTYNIFFQNTGTGFDSSGYYRKYGSKYFEYFDVGTYLGYDSPLWAEYIMVIDSVSAGTNWKSAGFTGNITVAPNPPQSFTLRFSYTILQKDVPITVVTSTGSVTYQNVIVVEEKYEQQTSPTTWQDLTSSINFYGKSYYARGVGLIKYEALDATGTVTGQQALRRSVVY